MRRSSAEMNCCVPLLIVGSIRPRLRLSFQCPACCPSPFVRPVENVARLVVPPLIEKNFERASADRSNTPTPCARLSAE
jgi:hypothetical protein